jgi:hypothetical protein
MWDLQSDSFESIVRIAQVPLLAGNDPSELATRHPRPPRPHPRNAEKGQAVNAVQETLGTALLLLVSLAAVLFAVILLLLEAKVILLLGGQLNRDLRFPAPPPVGQARATRHRPAPEPGPEEERRDDAAR